jgi:hypothetical protein
LEDEGEDAYAGGCVVVECEGRLSSSSMAQYISRARKDAGYMLSWAWWAPSGLGSGTECDLLAESTSRLGIAGHRTRRFPSASTHARSGLTSMGISKVSTWRWDAALSMHFSHKQLSLQTTQRKRVRGER